MTTNGEESASGATASSCPASAQTNYAKNKSKQKIANGVGCNESSNVDLPSPDLDSTDDTGSAPIEMLSEFLSAVMSRDYEAALKYCQTILEYEPNNKIVQEFYPLIQERIKQAEEEEAKSEDESISEDEEDIQSKSSGDDSSSDSDLEFEDSHANSTSDDYSSADGGGWTSNFNTDSERKDLP